jgi:predicted choloylglycine hydrolase
MYEKVSLEYDLIDGKFQHLVLEGSAYEVGQLQGEILKENKEMRARVEKAFTTFLTEMGLHPSRKPAFKEMGFRDFGEVQAVFEKHCPGLCEELEGFADALGAVVSELPFYGASYHAPRNCTQIALLSPMTDDGHIYVGRSYEWIHTEEDLRLCTTRVKGKARHIGFSSFLFGRADGMNEHGVSVTFTGGGVFGVPLRARGFQALTVIRTILDRARSVADAVELIERMPISGYFNLLIADKESRAALVEFADGSRDARRIDVDGVGRCLFSTNHYTLPATEKSNELNCGIIGNSRQRYQLLTTTFEKAEAPMGKEALRTVLSAKFPEGLCDHYYSDSFGTLWSSIFDLTLAQADICFGAPTHNRWQTLPLDELVGVKEYAATFPNCKGEWPY